MMGPTSPYVITTANCSGGPVWSTNSMPGRQIVTKVPSQRQPPAVVGFTALVPEQGFPAVHQMQEAYSGTAKVREEAAIVNVSLPRPMSEKYQVFLTPNWNSGSVWVINRSSTSFCAGLGTPPTAEGAELDWHVRSPPWEGTPTPLNGG